MKAPFEWDYFSDQPKVLEDKNFKNEARKQHATDFAKTLATSLFVLPLATVRAGLHALIKKDKFGESRTEKIPVVFFGMGVSLDHGNVQWDLIDEIGVTNVLLRVPLWDRQRLGAYRAFAFEFKKRGKNVLVNVLQDREHITDRKVLIEDLSAIFESFDGICSEYQIGNAINRLKWGFFSIEEYLAFFHSAQMLRDEKYPNAILLGPGVIDFEYHYTSRALFNNWPVRFDRVSALLYVDRRGSPLARQYGVFDLDLKVRILGSLIQLSSRVKNTGIYITEVNWPLSGTAPYAPTSERECVTMNEYCHYMRLYHQIAYQTGLVSRVYWHQLIAPGYGLIDNRGNGLKKTAAFEAYKKLVLNDLFV